MRQVEASVFEQERKELQSEQDRLLLKMERKGEQISKLYKHKTQVGSHPKNSSHNHTTYAKSLLSLTLSCLSFLDQEVKKRG